MLSNRVKKSQPHFYQQVSVAGTATFFMHPVRIALNQASLHTSPVATVKDVYGDLFNLLNRTNFYRSPITTIKNTFGYLFRGATFNIMRGGLSAGLQAHANDTVSSIYNNTTSGKVVGIFCASMTGATIATLLETLLMRKTASSQSNFSPSYKFNVPISSFFFLREIGFTGAVFGSKDLSQPAQYATFLSAAWLTAACHKLAMIEATKDLAAHGYTVPDYRNGVRQVYTNLATGAYTHPALRTLIPTPTNFLQRSANVAYATCGANMFFFRLLYLKGFSEARLLAKDHIENNERKLK